MSCDDSGGVPLLNWIQQRRLQRNDNTGGDDNDYLMLQLRIACSLADQICTAEEEAGLLPTPSSDWINSITVYLQANNSEEDKHQWKDDSNSSDSVGSLDPKSDDNFNVEDIFNELIHEDESLAAVTEGAIDNHTQEVLAGDSNCIRVEMLPSLFCANNEEEAVIKKSMVQRIIHSLAIVFYELFSGGERPPPAAAAAAQSSQTNNETTADPSQLRFDNLDPLPFDESVSIDVGEELGRILNTDDNPSGGGDIEVDNLSNQAPRKKRAQIDVSSVEPLKAKGLPLALCDLIANMLGCINGNINEVDAYQNISEVRDDLQLMLDKPAIYLYDQDMLLFSNAGGLQFGETMFGRNAELSSMKDAYRRSVSDDNELVTIISGPSGSGKTLLAYEFGNHVILDGGMFLSGKFDQLQQGKPFSALASAFNQHCDILLQNSVLAPTREKFANEVKSSLGSDAYLLAILIPNLATILGLQVFDNITHDIDCINAQKRLQYLLCCFVDVMCSVFTAPVALFLDDLQWADAASIAAVNQLIYSAGVSSQNTRFFFLGCYRAEEEINEDHPVSKLLWNVDALSVGCIHVKLDYMEEDTLNMMVSETLHLSPRITRPLSSVIYHKTKGNPLFISRLMASLSKEGLLRLNLSRRRWEWDLDKIRCQKLPDDVAKFLTQSIEALPEDVKSSLFVLSCFGAWSNVSLIELLDRSLDLKLLDNLDIAVDEGLLDKRNGQYRFCHDRIQEAAYKMIEPQYQCLRHFKYGMELAQVSQLIYGDNYLFTAVNQLNLGGPKAVQEDGDYVKVANLNLKAGKKAIGMSDYVTAYRYFDHGITFLRKKHWEEHYGLSLELYDLAAKCALANGDVDMLNLLSQQVLMKGRSFQDKLNMRYLTTCALAKSSKLPEAISKGVEILSQLGITLPQTSMESCIRDTKYLLANYSDDGILNTRQMTDPNMIMAMKFLGKLIRRMTQIMPKSVASVTQIIIQLSLLHGMSPVSPIGFAHFGSIIAKLGDIRGGYHYVKLALSLLDKVGSRESAGEVICFATNVRTYLEPLQSVLESFNDGYTAAMTSGDVGMAAVNRAMATAVSFYSSANLQTMREKYAKMIEMMEKRKQMIFLVQNLSTQRSIFRLVGSEEKQKYVIEEQTIIARNNSVLRTYCFQKAYISFIFRSYDDTKIASESYFACSETTWANLLIHHAPQTFYIGLISFWVARKSREEQQQQQQQQWYQRGNKSKLELKHWAESSRWNFEHKWYLLEAEEAFCNSEFESAKFFYEKAISSATDHKVRLVRAELCLLY
jgi:predicted ATPase